MNHQHPTSSACRTQTCSSITDWGSSHGLIQPSPPSGQMHRHPSKSTPCQPAKTPSITKACLWLTCVKLSQRALTKLSNSLMKKSTLMTLKSMPSTPHSIWNSMRKTTMTTAMRKIMMKTVTTTMTKTATTIMTIMMVDTKVMLTLRLRKPSLIQRAAQLTR